MIIDKLPSELEIQNKSSRFKGRAIHFLLTKQSQAHSNGVTKAHVRGAPVTHCTDKMYSIKITYRASRVSNEAAFIMLYNTLVLPYFTYCSEVWGRAYRNNLYHLNIKQK